MTPILFYGVPSGCSFGSIVALEWLGKPYRLSRIDMPEVVQSDAYRRINPVGETPSLLTEDERIISESLAILNHLGTSGTEKGLAFKQGTAGFDRLNQALAYLNTSFFNSFSPLWYTLEHDMKPDAKQALRTYGAANVAKAHGELEKMLGKGPWLLGNQRTLADAYFIGIARWTKYHDVVDRQTYPGLQSLFERLEDDPAVKFAHAIEHGEEARGAGGFLGHVSLERALSEISDL
ncbi:glutathione S-transferase family protein [Taklimakanibacter deserti]|uniref:glutathione S-transferase family protein n=1 Tax=Taklimakanibacter deserti TaxID=2267839 RepID=UPI000E64EAC3